MEDDVFRWVLLALGSCIIAAVAVHGIWTSRKNRKNNAAQNAAARPGHKQQFQPGGWQDDDWQTDEDDVAVHNHSNPEEDVELNIDFSLADSGNIRTVPAKTTLQPGEFDDLGLGAVRVVGSNQAAVKAAKTSNTDADDLPSLADFEPSKQVQTPESKPVPSGKVYASVVTQPKPEYAAKYANAAGTVRAMKVSPLNKASDNYQAPEPPPSLLKTEEPAPASKNEVDVDALKQTARESETSHAVPTQTKVAEKFSLAEQARNLVMGKKAESAAKRREPKIAADQMRIDFDDEVADSTPKTEGAAQARVAEVKQEVLVLNVKTAEGVPIQGAALLPMLLTLGFKFGDQDIFHRHVNSNGKGPVLFSLANMFKPGNFDIDKLENFTTQGLSLFMILPIEGDPHQVFNMMHNAARKIADEFSAQVYDGRRALLTKQSLQQYVEKIREFERKRMVNR